MLVACLHCLLRVYDLAVQEEEKEDKGFIRPEGPFHAQQ